MFETDRFIFSLGKTQIFNENANKLPIKKISGKAEGYFISILPAMDRLVFVDANDDQGYVHATQTILQLINKENQVYHHYDIIDFPDIETRAIILPLSQRDLDNKLISHIRKLTDVGYNMIYFQEGNGIEFFTKDDVQMQTFRTLTSEIKSFAPNCNFGVSFLNLRFRSQNKDENQLAYIRMQAEKIGKLINEYKASGLTNFIITDEVIWDFMDLGSKAVSFEIITSEELEEFLANTSSYLSGIENKIKAIHEQINILLMPVLSTNENILQSSGYATIYFNQIHKYNNLFDGIIWKGPSDLPLQIDVADSYHFRSASNMINYLLVNTLTTRKENKLNGGFASIYPGKARTGSIFEALDIQLAETPVEMGLASCCIINQNEYSSLSKIRLMTAADYLWNMKGYKPAESIWKALFNLYGKEEAIRLIRFTDKYYELLQLCMILEKEKFNQKNYKSGENIIVALNTQWNEITKDLSSEIELLNELSDIKNQLISRFYKIKRPSSPGRS